MPQVPLNHTHPVLDKGFVELQDFMPHPATGISGDMAIVSAARVSFMGESKGDEADYKLLRRLLKDQHTSPFEQVQFKFRVKAPLMVYWQWVRHRTFHFQSVNSQSGRYSEFEEEDFYFPTARQWRKQSASNKQGSAGLVFPESPGDASWLEDKLHDLTAEGYHLYAQALAKGVAKEQARLFLPAFGVYYTWVMSVDALNLMNFLRLRLADDAQWEIRQYATVMYGIFSKCLPWTAEAFDEFVLKQV